MSTNRIISTNESKSLKNLIEFQDYYLIKDSKVHKILIGKRKSDLLFKCQKYELRLKNIDLAKLTKYKYNNIDEAYKYIVNLFEQNKIIINEITVNKSIKLKLELNISKDIEIILLYNKENKDLVINELNNNYNELKNDINNLKDEISKLRKDIINLKINNNKINSVNTNTNTNINSNNKNKSFDPKEIKYSKELINDSYAKFALDNTFSVFKSINDIFYLIYTNKNISIIAHDLIDNRKIIEIKKAHEQYITNFRHYLDKIKKRDLLISISGEDNNIKLWNINNFDLLLNINNINKDGFLDSACFLNNNINIYIITSNVNYLNPELLKVFDFKGNLVKEINNSNDITVFLDSYYEPKTNRNYIISGSYGFVKSYDFQKDKIFHKYFDGDNNKSHDSIIISKEEDVVKLIGTTEDGYIRIWNFHSGILINKILASDCSIYGICLWSEDYVFVGSKDKSIKLIDIKSGKIVNNLIGCNNYVLTLKKIFFPKYGECLVSQGWKNEPIQLWTNKSN